MESRQLDLFSLFASAPKVPLSWTGVRLRLDRFIPDWEALHPAQLGQQMRAIFDQDDIYSAYVELKLEHAVSRDLVHRATLTRHSNALYVAMDGATARRTFGDDFKQAIRRATDKRRRRKP